jgi:catechol 2,3-dioxygenase-like lactoylglutathione lyase family enzyme
MPLVLEGCVALLQVFDMPVSVAFYRDVLGFKVIHQSRPGDEYDWALLSHGNAEVMLNTMYERDDRPEAPDPKRAAAHDDTCLFFGCADVDGAYEYLRSKGVEVRPPAVAPYGMKQLWLHDPDGYGLCFQWPAG